jgi:hypothetical protein
LSGSGHIVEDVENKTVLYTFTDAVVSDTEDREDGVGVGVNATILSETLGSRKVPEHVFPDLFSSSKMTK